MVTAETETSEKNEEPLYEASSSLNFKESS